MSRRSALLILVAVSLTAAIVLAQTPPDWWIPFDDKGDDGNGNGGDEKEPFSFDPPEWWPEFQPKDITNSSKE